MTDLLVNEVEQAEPWTFAFPADRLGEFQHIIEKANRRLERAGATARFEPSIVREDRSITQESGLSITVPYVIATMEQFRLSLGRYTFVARLVPEEAGMTVHTAPGESLEGWVRPAADDQHCDHCEVKRNRINLYVVRDEETGEFIQLGQQCIQLYTGLEPKGLWALTFDQVIADEMGESDGGWGGGRREYSVSIDEVLALSLALTNGGAKYVSKANAEAWNKSSTSGDIQRALFGNFPSAADVRRWPGLAEERQRFLDAIDKAAEIAKDTALLDAVKASASTLKAGTDYADNMAIILAAESGLVSRWNIGTLGSLVAVYHRTLEREAERKARPQAAAGFIGAVGERVRDFTVTTTSVRQFDGMYGTTTLLVGVTEDGHVVKWFASNPPYKSVTTEVGDVVGSRGVEPGDVLHFAAATVKAHDNYQGTDQTVLTRGHKVTIL
jgi:hypothetical protein